MLNIIKINPLDDQLITTMCKYEEDVLVGGGLIDSTKQKGALKEWQTIMSVGPLVRGLKVGDKVMVNPKRFAVMKHQKGSLKDGVVTDNPVVGYQFDVVTINGQDCLLLRQGDILYSFEGEEIAEGTPKQQIIVPDNKIIL